MSSLRFLVDVNVTPDFGSLLRLPKSCFGDIGLLSTVVYGILLLVERK